MIAKIMIVCPGVSLRESVTLALLPSPGRSPELLPDPGGGIPGVPADAAGISGQGREDRALALRLGVLTREISPELVDAVVEQAGRCEHRRRLLPAATVVYFVLGLCLFSGADSMVPPGYRSVMRLSCLRAEAALAAGIDPDRISFTVTLRVARAEVTNQAAATPATLRRSRALAIGDLLADRLPPRRARQYERIRKAPKSNYTIKKHDHVRAASHVTYKIKVTRKADLAAPMP